MDYSYELKVPKDRIGVIIGKSGEIKKNIEDNTCTKMQVNSKEGDITISGEDAIGLLTAREITKAIGRGFSPEVALSLLKPDYAMEMINIQDFSGKSKSSIERLRGRVIGREGRSRKTIEDLTETNICVYGKSISIIGQISHIANAKKAVFSLLSGSQHAAVYKWLEKKRREDKSTEMLEKHII